MDGIMPHLTLDGRDNAYPACGTLTWHKGWGRGEGGKVLRFVLWIDGEREGQSPFFSLKNKVVLPVSRDINPWH